MVSPAGTASWPAVQYERLVWDSRLRGLAGTRADRRRAYGTYQATVPPQIADLAYPLERPLAGAVDDATAELARYDAELADGPIPMDGILLRSESAASSQIENLTASARSVGLAELGATSTVNAQLIVANGQAMRQAIALADELSAEAVLAMHKTLLLDTDPSGAGRWRDEPVWIGTSSISPIGADFVAPAHERVPALMTWWRTRSAPTSPCSHRRQSLTRSSRPSTRSPTAMGVRVVPCCTRCFATTA